MSTTIHAIEQLYNQALAALEAGHYRQAMNKALACKMRLATLPNISRSLAGGGQQSLQWANAATLDSFIAHCNRLAATTVAQSSGPFQQTKVIYARPDAEGGFC